MLELLGQDGGAAPARVQVEPDPGLELGADLRNGVLEKKKQSMGSGTYSTEVAFALLTQLPWVRYSAFAKNYFSHCCQDLSMALHCFERKAEGEVLSISTR